MNDIIANGGSISPTIAGLGTPTSAGYSTNNTLVSTIGNYT